MLASSDVANVGNVMALKQKLPALNFPGLGPTYFVILNSSSIRFCYFPRFPSIPKRWLLVQRNRINEIHRIQFNQQDEDQ